MIFSFQALSDRRKNRPRIEIFKRDENSKPRMKISSENGSLVRGEWFFFSFQGRADASVITLARRSLKMQSTGPHAQAQRKRRQSKVEASMEWFFFIRSSENEFFRSLALWGGFAISGSPGISTHNVPSHLSPPPALKTVTSLSKESRQTRLLTFHSS